ncbi:hypothetical protein [Ktedonospora formicarum]|uniref:Uncharacterized protein n=1 Tax=Ktedonospora formicarum TaxID=2778364 RepID=A0A8J3I6B8_9CHLR|nr:hypothetical protein [Ktedonospora formicarum]GHO51152.1 hypothetical protein KSX_93150 [Ktedonospora formicarum]GHO51490.1 hypothetical protein KSX_96530 [Ktedonospora formicarum]
MRAAAVSPGAEVLVGNVAGGVMLALQACREAGVTSLGRGTCRGWKDGSSFCLRCVSDEK